MRAAGVGSVAKESIAYTVRLLSCIGVACPPPEALRQAKFECGGAAVCAALLRALHDVCVLALCGFPECASAGALQDAWRGGGDDALLFMRRTLEEWGCPASLLALLPTTASACGALEEEQPTLATRPLLLALAWALAHSHALEHALRVRLQRSTEPLKDALLPPFPFDVACTPAARASGSACAREASMLVEDAASLRQCAAAGGERASLAARHALLLQGRARGCVRQLAGLTACGGAQVHKLLTHTAPASLSPYELHLLRSPATHLAGACAAAEAAAGSEEEAAAWTRHQATFFAWAGSALDEEASQVPQAPPAGHAPHAPHGDAAGGGSSWAEAERLRARAEARLAATREAAAALGRRWQSLRLSAEEGAALQAHAAAVDAALPSLARFLEAAACGGAHPERRHAAALPEDVRLAVEGAAARRASSAAVHAQAVPSYRVALAAQRRPGAAAAAQTSGCAEELARLRRAARDAAQALAAVRRDNARALRCAVQPFAQRPQFLLAGWE